MRDEIWRVALKDKTVKKVLDNSTMHLGIEWGWFRIAPDSVIVTGRTLGSTEIYSYRFETTRAIF
jgi:hypothetical protein